MSPSPPPPVDAWPAGAGARVRALHEDGTAVAVPAAPPVPPRDGWQFFFELHLEWRAYVYSWWLLRHPLRTLRVPACPAVALYVDLATGRAAPVTELPAVEPGAVRIVCISDTHTHHGRVRVPAGDVLVHAGDLTYMNQDYAEVARSFNAWSRAQPQALTFFTPGNHDGFCEKLGTAGVRALMPDVFLAAHAGLEVRGCKIFGNAYSRASRSCNRAFTGPAQLELLTSAVPADTDVFVSHTGRDVEMDRLLARLQPRVHIYGHDHEFYGVQTVTWPDTGRVTVRINAASLDDYYHPVNLPVVFDYVAAK